MKALLSWLNELAPVGDDVAALADTMNELGLAVDGIETVGAPIDGVVVAKVLALRRHPDADRMQLVDVDGGTQRGGERNAETRGQIASDTEM